MLLAPFTVAESTQRSFNPCHDETRVVPPWLLLWAVGGILAIAGFPVLRGDELTGMSLPFWLIAAPLINIAWLGRSRGWVRLRDLGSRMAQWQNTRVAGCVRLDQARVPRRLRSMRRRNSAMMRR